MDAKTYAKSVLKVQGKDNAVRMVKENLGYSEKGFDTTPFSDELVVSFGDDSKNRLVVNEKKKFKRLNKNLNFWKNVNIELTKLLK